MHEEEIIRTFLTSNIYIGLCHPDALTLTQLQFVRNIRSLANRQTQQQGGPLGNFQIPPAKRRVSVPAGKRDSSERRNSIACTLQRQNCTPTSSWNNSHVAHITQRVTSTTSATQQQSINTPTAPLGTRSRSRLALGGTSQTDSTRRVVSSPASGIACHPTPLRGLEHLPTPIPNPEARVMITNPLRT